jgi:hypothetical protein
MQINREEIFINVRGKKSIKRTSNLLLGSDVWGDFLLPFPLALWWLVQVREWRKKRIKRRERMKTGTMQIGKKTWRGLPVVLH